MRETDKVIIAGALWTRNLKNRSFLIVGGVRVSYAHLVYSPTGLSPTVCSAHFQPLIVDEYDETDQHHT